LKNNKRFANEIKKKPLRHARGLFLYQMIDCGLGSELYHADYEAGRDEA